MEENSFVLSWKNLVQEEMKRLTTEPKTEKELINNAWRKNRELMKTKKSSLQSVVIPFNEKDYAVPEADENQQCAKLFQQKKVVEKTPIITIPPVDPPPTQTMWVPIQRNILPDKEIPTNIPYFGDEVIEKDTKFIASLVEDLNHVTSNESLSDERFMKLVSALNKQQDQDASFNTVLFHPTTKTEQQYCTETMKQHQLPRLIVFQAISAAFPEHGTSEDLVKRYKELRKKTEEEQFAPNIDGPNPADLSAEETLHSYKSLLCRRCFLYDCPLHRDDPVIDAPLQRANARELPIPTEPCGSRCYMNIPGTGVLLSPRTPMNNRSKQKVDKYQELYSEERAERINALLNPNNTQSDVWTAAEKSLYRVCIQSFPGNFCAVAQALGTKKCDQVFNFSVQEGKTSRGERKKKSLKAKKFGKTQQAQLYKHTQDGKKENKRPYIPCNHPGKDCDPDVCSCRENNNFCEKFCYCPINCRDRFPGCRCRSNCKTKMCPCFLASRECDPDLCMNCLDGKPEYNPDTNSCQNVYLQRFMGKKLYVAPSDIAGMGCFIGETAEKNDFIAEYVGEMITHEECESRGRVYDMAKSSYMFNLNEEYIVDAARFGGVIRFANHSAKPNCQVKILLVNGDYRIGIYAKQHIQLGEELFFDYGKDFVGHDLIEH